MYGAKWSLGQVIGLNSWGSDAHDEVDMQVQVVLDK